MKHMNVVMPIAFVSIVGFGAVILTASWDRQEKEANEFARKCNEKGGVAEYHEGMRQCLIYGEHQGNLDIKIKI